VRGVLESAIQLAWHEIHHRARLTRVLAEVPPVEANEARLAQVFLCLLLNAAQAIPEGRADENEVRVVTRADGGDIVVEIADTGAGIADEALARIFDPFFTTKGEAGASGLGLSFAFGTARSMGGDLRVVESPAGRGTTFRLTLPAARAHRLGPSSGKVRAASPRKRMLLVEDEAFVREALVQALSEHAEVVALGDAREALERIGAREDFDLVLCDLMMPVMTGMDLYVEIVRSAPQLAKRVVFMTGGAFTAAARAFLDGVSNPCLEKPLDMDRLRNLLGRA
jgi:CheY-like chemotaxis protein/anti-sigma regulatory factor (Ser/Thr protein kinase)